MAQYDVDLRDYWRILKKRKLIVFLMVFLVSICSYVFALFREPDPLYQAEAAIKIKQTTNLSAILSGSYWYQSDSMITHSIIITSFNVLARTAKLLEKIPEDASFDEIQESQKHQDEIRQLKHMITTNTEPGTSIINIYTVSGDRQYAAKVANSVANAFQDYNTFEKNEQTNGMRDFIDNQVEKIETTLRSAEEDLQDFQEEHSLVAIDYQTQNMLQTQFNVEEDIRLVRKEKEDAKLHLKLLKGGKNISSEDFKGVLFTPEQDSPVYRLRGKLGDLLLERETLLIDYTERHPKVVAIDDRIKAIIDETVKELQSYLHTLEKRESVYLNKLGTLERENMNLPKKAFDYLRLQREVELQHELFTQLKTKQQEAQIQASSNTEDVIIIKPAIPPTNPFNAPPKLMILVTGLIMGLIIGVIAAFSIEMFDTSMGTIEDVESILEVPVLGVIPSLPKEGERGAVDERDKHAFRKKGLVTHYDPKSLVSESFRTLRTNIQFLSLDKKGKSFLITSSFVQEGKTFNSVNLALSMAQAGNKVLLMSADLRKPVINKMFGLERKPGITDYVLGNYQEHEVIQNIADIMLGEFELDEILGTPGLDNLHIVTAGTKPPNPTEIVRSARFKEFLKYARKNYDIVIVDAPPVLPVADATEIAAFVDGVIIVYMLGKIGRSVLKRAKKSLDNINSNVMGAILNNVKPEAGPEYFRYHAHYYETPIVERRTELKTIIDFFKRLMKPLQKDNYMPIAALIIGLFILILAFFFN